MTEDAKAAVLELAHTHYKTSDNPIYLASVGQTLRGLGLWPIKGETGTLKDWLKTLEPDLIVVQDETTPARVAIVTPDKAKVVEQLLFALRDTEFLGALARPALLAFVVRGEEKSPVFLTRRPPFKYTMVAPRDPEAYHVIPPDYRIPGLPLMNSAKMAPSDIAHLAHNIRNWSNAFAVDLASLSRTASAEASRPVQEEVAIGTMSALDRLIAAQRAEVRQQLVIPADIAALLSRHK